MFEGILFLASGCAILVGRESRSQATSGPTHFASSPTRSVRSEDAETTENRQVSLVHLFVVANALKRTCGGSSPHEATTKPPHAWELV